MLKSKKKSKKGREDNTTLKATSYVSPSLIGTTSTGTSYTPLSSIEMVKLIEYDESIEIIYKELTSSIFGGMLGGKSESKCFKIIFRCKDGKFHKSERIYGQIHEATEESYEFY